MAMTQFPQGFAGAMGSAVGGGLAGLGSGIGGGIETLINLKLKNLQEEQHIKQAEQSLIPYVGAEKAKALGPLTVRNPQLASSILKEEMQAPYREQLGQAWQQALGGGQAAPDMGAPGGGIMEPGVAPAGSDIGALPRGLKPQDLAMLERARATRQKQTFKEQEAVKKATRVERREAREDKKFFEKRRQSALTNTAKQREKIDKEGLESEKELEIIKSAAKLLNKGNMDNPIVKQFFDKFGINFDAWKKGDTKTFEAYMDNLTRMSMTSVTGVRSKYVYQALRAMHPTSFQTDEQKRALLQIGADIRVLPALRRRVQNQIMDEYKGKILPDNYSGLIDEGMEQYYDEIIDKTSKLAGVPSPLEAEQAAETQPQMGPSMEPPVGQPPIAPTPPAPALPVEKVVKAAKPIIPKEKKLDIPEELRLPPAKPKPLKKGKMSEAEIKAEGWGEWAGRNVARTGVKATASALGFPGDMIDAAKSLVEYGVSKAVGTDVKLPDKVIPIPGFAPFLELAKWGINKALGTKLDFPTMLPIPTSSRIRNAITAVGKIFSGEPEKVDKLMTPQGAFTKATDNAAEAIAPMLILPIVGLGTGIARGASMAVRLGRTAYRGLKIAGAAEAAGALSEYVGIGKTGTEAIKAGTVLGASLFRPGSIKRFIKKGWNDNLTTAVLQEEMKSARSVGQSVNLSKFDAQTLMLKRLEQGNKVSNFINKHLSFRGRTGPFKIALGWVVGPGMATKVFVGGKALAQAARVEGAVRMLAKYPFLRKPFLNCIKAAARGNARQMIKQFSKLNEATKKIKD